AFDEFRPLTIRPHAGASWAPAGHLDRLPANYHKPARRPAVPRLLLRRRRHPLGCGPARSIRCEHPGRAQIDPQGPAGRGANLHHPGHLSAHRGLKIREWAARNRVELCFTPTYSSWDNPIEAHYGPLRTFTVARSNGPNHPTSTRAIHAYLRWRNANALGSNPDPEPRPDRQRAHGPAPPDVEEVVRWRPGLRSGG